MAQTFSEKLIQWRGERSHSEGAELLGIPKTTFRKYIYGKRTPGTLARLELERRMAAIDNESKAKKASGEPDKAAKGVRCA